ncbi:MAG TPA: response regulator [Methylomirabilota bacterium]|nr:response regulator [Methylomirabilota bacterium]
MSSKTRDAEGAESEPDRVTGGDEALSRQETEHQAELLHRIFDNVPVLLVLWDPRLQRFSLNPCAEDALGWTTDEANSVDFMAEIYPDEAYRAETAEYMQSLAPGYRTFVCTARDGTEIPIDWANVRLSDETLLGIGVDLRRRIAAEEAVRTSREHLEWVLERTGVGTWFNEMPLNRLNWDLQSRRQFFVPDDAEPTIELFWSRLHPDDREPTRLAVERAIREHGLYEIDHRAVCPETGEIRWIRSTGQATYDADGTPLRFDGINYDITDRKRAEAGLRRLTETLEQQVAERTAVAERRALDLRRLASELSDAEHRERKRLAKLLHDDVQQLLSAVRFSLDVAPRVPADQLEDHVRKIDEMVVTCQETARSLTYELSPPILQAGTLVEVAEWLVRWFGEHHGLRVDLNVAGQVPAASEHGKVLLFQVLREVLFNVVKHSGTLVARVDLSTRNGFLVVVVEDDGGGFDPQAVESRLQRPTSFGLFNIRERLDALGGGLVIDATPQRGARLRLELPLAEDLDSEPAIPPPRELDAATARTPEAGPKEGVIRLLVVDDHTVVRESFVGLLDLQPDLEVVGEAADGEAAVQLAEELRPDVVVMDLNLPGIDGLEATRRIKAMRPDVVVVGLSFHEDEAYVRAMIEAGADAYASKSDPSGHVIATIRRACGSCRG